jgi:hypothetical protein
MLTPPVQHPHTLRGAIPRTEAPQALIGRTAPRHLRAAPAGTRYRRPSPHRMARAVPGPLAHQSRARTYARQAVCPRAAPVRRAGPHAGGGWRSRLHGGMAPPGAVARTLSHGRGPPGRSRDAWSLAFHPLLRPLLWTVPLSPHATCSSCAQDHDCRLRQPSYHETAWTRDPRAGGQTRARSWKVLLGRGVRCLGARVAKRVPMRRPFQCTKEPYRRVMWAKYEMMHRKLHYRTLF